MDASLKDDKRAAAAKYSRLAFIFGVISLAGLILCFPIMPVFGGLGIVFAIISRGGANVYTSEAKKGLTFSRIYVSNVFSCRWFLPWQCSEDRWLTR